MTKVLLYGNSVLDLLKLLPSKERTIILIRHSERPSLEGIPISAWNGIGLTERGVEAAGDFGRELAGAVNGANLRVYGWGLQRCIDTANAIAEGAEKAGGSVVDRRVLRLKSPIADRAGYEAAQMSGQWMETVEDWLRGGLGSPMVPIHEYGPEILRSLLDPTVSVSGETSVVVTHDLQIMAFSSHLFGVPTGWPDFLDGPVMKADDSDMQAGLGELVMSIPLARALN